MSTDRRQELLTAVDDSALAIASLTGIKAQLVDQGWSETSAEQLVIEMFRLNNRGAK